MQDSSLYSQIQPQFPEQEQLKCPRCDSANTKFCYYNNYNLSQPRHFCKSCKRYWTKGGALRNIPVGGASRKTTKRSSSSSSSSATSAAASKRPAKDKKDGDHVIDSAQTLPLKGDDFGGQFGNLSFSSLLGSHGDHYVGFLDGLGPNGPTLQITDHFGDPGSGRNLDPGLEIDTSANGDHGFLNMQGGAGAGDGGCWGGGSNEWPDLAIYTPSSNFQ